MTDKLTDVCKRLRRLSDDLTVTFSAGESIMVHGFSLHFNWQFDRVVDSFNEAEQLLSEEYACLKLLKDLEVGK